MDTMVVFYTWQDDGVWLRCTKCGVEISLDFEPSVPSVVRAAEQHKCKRKQP